MKSLLVVFALALGVTSCESLPVTQATRDRNADRNVALALQNHRLKIEQEDLKQALQEKGDYYDSVMRDLRGQITTGRVKVSRYKDTLTLDVSDEVLFDSGKAKLKALGKEVLLEVAKAIVGIDRTVRVVGHTDDQAMAPGAVYPTNWELSTARATTVVRYLQETGGLDPRRLLAGGRGPWMPVANNATPEGRQRNRRITITLVDPSYFDGSGPIPVALKP